ncbi:MAG: LamG-like jellyroll fold domain-containing protein [Fuerstiella sp.]
MGEKEKTDDLDQIIACVVDGTATADDMAQLNRLLDGNPEGQRRYVRYMDLHHELLERSGAIAESPAISVSVKESKLPKAWIALIGGLAASLLVALGFAISHGWSSGEMTATNQFDASRDTLLVAEESEIGVAVLTRAVNAEWLGEGPSLTGHILSPGRLQLKSGHIEVKFYNGVKLLVEGPADFQLVSVDQVVCHEGKLRSIVPPNATGFSVMTPQFELVDLGTEFAVDVAKNGRSDAHVFDGEVELYLPDGKREPVYKHVLYGGDAMAWSSKGMASEREANPESFSSFESIRIREQASTRERFRNWQDQNRDLSNDPRVVSHYDFQSKDSDLLANSGQGSDGSIIGCEWTTGRWAEKNALEFKRPSDRVRIQVPGEFDALTLAAWIRIDALPRRRQSLLLSDGSQSGQLTWQISPRRGVDFSYRATTQEEPNVMYRSPRIFKGSQLGVWNFVCVTYDRANRQVAHWVDGKQISTAALKVDQPVHIGVAEIGNRGVTAKPRQRSIRNFVGRIDELTIWDEALSEKEIRELYMQSLP